MGYQFVFFELLDRAETLRALITVSILSVDLDVYADGVDRPESFTTMVTFEWFALLQLRRLLVVFVLMDSTAVASVGGGIHEGLLARLASHYGADFVKP